MAGLAGFLTLLSVVTACTAQAVARPHLRERIDRLCEVEGTWRLPNMQALTLSKWEAGLRLELLRGFVLTETIALARGLPREEAVRLRREIGLLPPARMARVLCIVRLLVASGESFESLRSELPPSLLDEWGECLERAALEGEFLRRYGANFVGGAARRGS